MLAVRDLLGLEPVAGLYQPLRGDDLRARGVFLGEAERRRPAWSPTTRATEEQLREAARRRGGAGGRAGRGGCARAS